MLTRWQFNALTGLGGLSLLLTLVNATLFTFNRDAQAAIAQRQQYIQQSIALEGLYREIVKALAESATRGNDRGLLDILAAQGLSVTVDGAAMPASGAASVNGGRGK
ncbi:MAG: hypothetical protein ABI364_08535 [Caldimonas sp.]